MPADMATYRKPNWPSDMKTPTATMLRHGASGRLMKKMAGQHDGGEADRDEEQRRHPAMPQSMTTKLKPQMVATRAARSESRVFTRPVCGIG